MIYRDKFDKASELKILCNKISKYGLESIVDMAKDNELQTLEDAIYALQKIR